jgi:hypothetical protein
MPMDSGSIPDYSNSCTNEIASLKQLLQVESPWLALTQGESMKATQVTEPVAKIQHGPNSYTAIYVLRDKTQKFRMPGVKDDSPRAWDYGPSIITERISPSGCDTRAAHPDDKNVWKWLDALLNVGAHVMNDDHLSKAVPAELKEYWG